MILNVACTIAALLIANFAWGKSPTVWTCTLFWATALLLIGAWARKLSTRAVMLLAVGAVMNLAVTVANGGHMPVVGKPAEFGSSVWVSSETHDNMLLLADRMALGGASPGDFVILAGLAFHLSAPFMRAISKIALLRRFRAA